MRHIYSSIFVIALMVACGAIPFRQKRQIGEQSILNNGIIPQDVDQSSDVDERLDDSESLPIVADLSEITQSSASNDRDTVDDAVEINHGEDEILNDRSLPDTGDVNLHEQNIDSGNGDYFEHEGADNDPILNEIFRESPGNHSNQGIGEIQDGPDSVVDQIETTSSQYSEQHSHNRRNLDEETDNQHFLLGEVDTDGNQILNMTDTHYERTFTLGVGRDDLDIGSEQKNEHQRHNDTDVIDHDREYINNATDENSVISNTDGTESGVTGEHIDSRSIEGSSNSTSGQQEGNSGGLNSIDHSQEHETELNGPNNENANSVGPDSGVDFPIDKGTHPHEQQGGIEHFNPPRHTYNPLTANISPSTEPTVETRTNPNIATGEPLILTMTTTTERNAPDEHLHHVSGGNEEHEHIGETGESQIHGINGENIGEGPETADHNEQTGHEATENPNTEDKSEEKQPGKDDAKNTHSVHLQTYSSLPISRNLSPTPTSDLRVPTMPLSTSYSAALEIASSRGDSFLVDTDIIDTESASLYDVQTIEYLTDTYPDDFPELKRSEKTYTSSTVEPLRILSTATSSIISTVSHSEPTSLQSFESSSISSLNRPVFSSMSHQYPAIVPTLSSVYHSEVSTTPGSSKVSISSRQENTHTSNQFPYVSNPSESSITMVSTSVASQTPYYTSSDTSLLFTTTSSSPSTTTSQLSVVTSSETNTPASQWLHSTPVSTVTSGTHQTLPSARTTYKKVENTTYITTTHITTRKKSDSDKDKPENSSSTSHLATIPASGTSTPLSTRNSVQVALTTQKVVLSTPPSVYIQIELRMGWYEFCSSKILFISQISNIILSEKEITVPVEQFKITTEYCSDANPTILNTGSITIQMYIVDNDGKIDVRLTLVTSDLIVKGFEDSNYFKDKIVSVHYHPNKIVEGIPNEKTLHKRTSPDVTMVIVIASVGGVCCFALIILQVILIHRRVKAKKKQRPLMGHRTSIQSLDHVALGVIPKSRPGSGYWNPALDGTFEELEPKELSHVLNFSLLANFCMDPRGIHAEFQTIPFDSPESPGVVFGEEDKNRFANVLPYKHSCVKLKSFEEKKSDYINANYVRGYKGAKHVYIATQSPLVNTVDDFWQMVWEQQSRVILMINPVTQHAKPKQSTCYWPDNLETDMRREYGDFTVTLIKRDVQQDYIDCTLELMDIERNLKREVHHFWYTCWSDSGPPEPLSFVKFVLDTRPHYENSGAPVVVHCGPGTGRSGTFIAVDICMRMFEDQRRVDILRCVHKMRNERAGAVQSREQYSLIYQSLNEYGVILSSPSISTRSSVVTLHAML